MELDPVDKRILRAVQTNCALSADELGQLCGASPSTALRRLKRLRDGGVITAEVAVVDPKKVGRPLLLIVGLRLDRDDAPIAAAFVRRMREHPAVTQCYFVTGSADYIIHISARDMDEYNGFVQTQLVSNPHVRMTETNVVISPLKVGLKVLIEG
jgi:Lrp/AsnC family transcriptional regulator, leucine-responsive regulatory protein